MSKFKKKPVIVEAFQLTRELSVMSSAWPEWLKRASWNSPDTPGALYTATTLLGDFVWMIHTLAGAIEVSWDDYIIQGIQGELYPCKPDIFEATYEAVEE